MSEKLLETVENIDTIRKKFEGQFDWYLGEIKGKDRADFFIKYMEMVLKLDKYLTPKETIESEHRLHIVGDIEAKYAVYIIRCRNTGMRYIGMTNKSFRERYPHGFYINHHNKKLMSDIHRFGINAFKVEIISCDSSEHAKELEHEMITRANLEYLYNVKLT